MFKYPSVFNRFLSVKVLVVHLQMKITAKFRLHLYSLFQKVSIIPTPNSFKIEFHILENIDFCSQSLRKQHIMLCIDTGLSCVFLKYPCHIIANCKLLCCGDMYVCLQYVMVPGRGHTTHNNICLRYLHSELSTSPHTHYTYTYLQVVAAPTATLRGKFANN